MVEKNGNESLTKSTEIFTKVEENLGKFKNPPPLDFQSKQWETTGGKPKRLQNHKNWWGSCNKL